MDRSEISFDDVQRAADLMREQSAPAEPAEVVMMPPGLMVRFCKEEGLPYSEDFEHSNTRFVVSRILAPDRVVYSTEKDYIPDDEILRRW